MKSDYSEHFYFRNLEEHVYLLDIYVLSLECLKKC
jgi:hypothetical protein